MSERLSQPSPEKSAPQPENSVEHQRPRQEKSEREPSQKEQLEAIQSIRKEVGKEAKQSGDVKVDQSSEGKSQQSTPPVNRELKNMMRVRTLTRIRKELPKPQRALSKVVHLKPVEAISTVGEKTVARPIGIVGGGLAAFTGSLVTFYMAKHYGFRYNLLLFVILFVAGYVAATLLEMIVIFLRRLRR